LRVSGRRAGFRALGTIAIGGLTGGTGRPFGHEFGGAVQGAEPDDNVVLLTIAAIGQRQLPALGIDAEDVLELVNAADGTSAERDDFVPFAKSAAIGFRTLQNLRNNDGALLVAFDRRAERGMVDDPAAPEVAEEIANLIAGDRVAGADVDASPLFDRDAALMITSPSALNMTARARDDRCIGLNAIGVFEYRTRGYCSVDAAPAERNTGLKSVASRNGLPSA
jgi:hypothetical protein